MLLFVENCEIRRYMESFLMFDCWNTQVEEFRVMKRIRVNSYLGYIKLKKYSIWTAQRDAYVVITYLKECLCLADDGQNNKNSHNYANTHFLTISSV
jgi:hypothetical protein